MPIKFNKANSFLVLFWLVLTLIVNVQVFVLHQMPLLPSLVHSSGFIIICISGAHTLGDLMLPLYLKKDKLHLFVILALCICIVSAAGLAWLDIWMMEKFSYDSSDVEIKYYYAQFCGMFIATTLATGTVCGIRFYTEHNKIEKAHRQLHAAHMEAELKHLRDQINPHFLFNVMNSINILIHKDTKQASSTLMKFSDMLRYQLYECSQDWIELTHEIKYLQNYINVERIRWGQDLKLDTKWHHSTADYRIAPLVLAPFVENAFKHVSHDRLINYIHINMEIRDDYLYFFVENSCSAENDRSACAEQGGFGLENVQKRLELLYPERYTLEITQHKNHYQVSLKLYLIHQKVLAS